MNQTVIGIIIVAVIFGVLLTWMRDDHRDYKHYRAAQNRSGKRDKNWYSKLD
jgi:hypothetical protein